MAKHRADAPQEEHGLARTQLRPEVMVWCTCGARFDAYGNKGATNKLTDHIMHATPASAHRRTWKRDTSDYYTI